MAGPLPGRDTSAQQSGGTRICEGRRTFGPNAQWLRTSLRASTLGSPVPYESIGAVRRRDPVPRRRGWPALQDGAGRLDREIKRPGGQAPEPCFAQHTRAKRREQHYWRFRETSRLAVESTFGERERSPDRASAPDIVVARKRTRRDARPLDNLRSAECRFGRPPSSSVIRVPSRIRFRAHLRSEVEAGFMRSRLANLVRVADCFLCSLTLRMVAFARA